MTEEHVTIVVSYALQASLRRDKHVYTIDVRKKLLKESTVNGNM